ncbi:hypothetical protein HGRIS_011124 [Hohenbuehelia grisea]|uniref:Manganese lipoxygenase n=1 Tax=Hohenbuehelia grisea TaxID=104357 RepID=A0ABR3IZ55_9AGAR
MATFEVPLVHSSEAVSLEASLKDLEEKKNLYQWSTEIYPPHIAKVPDADNRPPQNIFNPTALIETLSVVSGQCAPVTPLAICRLAPDIEMPKDFDELIKTNQKLRGPTRTEQNMLFSSNIGDRPDWDWYTDEVFAQQHLTGTNATTITLANDWVPVFQDRADAVGNEDMKKLLRSLPRNSLYVQDYSYFRSAMGLGKKQELTSGTGRYACAPVALFHLNDQGQLHPLAIVIDHKGSMADSVVIFNKRLTAKSSKLAQEKKDWPWRFAKMCVQSADWLRHEVTIHLVNTHLIEESVIVAAHRTLPPQHIVYYLLEKHWDTTLPLNALAREKLIPGVISPLAGVKGGQLLKFLSHAYTTFDWQGLHIPTDLEARGFPLAGLAKSPKFHNYAYGRNMARMWPVIRNFVEKVLTAYYTGGDAHVAEDKYIADFSKEMRSSHGANLASFPQITTLDELIDTVTMCIHIASPQHTAVNYLQHYYQVFVANKPWALYTPLPQTLEELNRYTEEEVFDSLPLKVTKDWLVGAQLPYLLSFEVVGSSSLLAYASEQAKSPDEDIAEAARGLEADLKKLQVLFQKHSDELDDKEGFGYKVMDPAMTAVSILI